MLRPEVGTIMHENTTDKEVIIWANDRLKTFDLFEPPHVEKWENGQYHVKSGNLTLTQTIINGSRFNECSEIKPDYSELCSQYFEQPSVLADHLVQLTEGGLS